MCKLSLKNRIDALTVFYSLKYDSVISALTRFLCDNCIENYASFVNAVYNTESGHLGKHIESIQTA